MLALKTKLIIGASALFLLISLSGIVYYQFKLLNELQEKLAQQTQINYNNGLALNDSLRFYINEQNQVVAQKLGFVYELTLKQDTYLKKQGYALNSIQTVMFQIKDLMLVDSGEVQITDSIATHKFQFDTLIVQIDGLTKIDLKKKEYSFTQLKLNFRPIKAKISISRNESGQVLGTATSLTPGITITALETEVDPAIFNKSYSEPRFLDLLRVGIMLGTNSEFSKWSMLYGFKIEYKAIGAWVLTSSEGQKFGLSISTPLSTFIK